MIINQWKKPNKNWWMLKGEKENWLQFLYSQNLWSMYGKIYKFLENDQKN